MRTVDVIIPTYRPTRRLFGILKRLYAQTDPIQRIILINTEETYFEQLIYGTSLEHAYDLDSLFQNVELRHISKEEFDHGGTRRLGVELSDADYFVCMTDDAVPADTHLIGELVGGLMQEGVAVCYARQLARKNSSETERYIRQFNYPEQACVKWETDRERLGIKTYFCSNVCAAYRRDVYEELGGFTEHTIFNEDMIYAAAAAKHGYGIAYQPSARVYHSHHYTGGQQFHRNFDLGVSQAMHPEVFAGLRSEGEGVRMIKKTAVHLCKTGKAWQLPGLIAESACKYAGYQLGRHYAALPEKLVCACTGNREFWKSPASATERTNGIQ
ncbi:MAG: glycosyltransferase family 2 protein [bacterium]|nr:glycosyltransferase family 2 protein [bacterium]